MHKHYVLGSFIRNDLSTKFPHVITTDNVYKCNTSVENPILENVVKYDTHIPNLEITRRRKLHVRGELVAGEPQFKG